MADAVTGDVLEISNLEQLKAFRDAVNNGESYKGKKVVLTADIDLGGEEWTPIGGGQAKYTDADGKTQVRKFEGSFDGQGHKISNLVVTGNNDYVGFFGYARDGEIKNLTIENAKVSGRVGVGALAGSPYTSDVSNITLTGHVEINGLSYVGGISGRNAYGDHTDITVDVDKTSYVKAYSIEWSEEDQEYKNYRTYVGGDRIYG